MESSHLPGDLEEAQIVLYRPFSTLAVLGLVLACLGTLVLVEENLWPVPLLGLVLCVAALRRISRKEGLLLGRRLALAGLFLSAMMLAAGAAQAVAYRTWIREEGVQAAEMWFECVRTQDRYKAYQLTMDPCWRPPPNAPLEEFARKGDWQIEVQTFANRPAVKRLLELGPRAQVRFERVEQQRRSGARQVLDLVFAVTPGEAGQDKPFSVLVELERGDCRRRGEGPWRLGQAGWRLIGVTDAAALGRQQG